MSDAKAFVTPVRSRSPCPTKATPSAKLVWTCSWSNDRFSQGSAPISQYIRPTCNLRLGVLITSNVTSLRRRTEWVPWG
jgi:hypothetical protein